MSGERVKCCVDGIFFVLSFSRPLLWFGCVFLKFDHAVVSSRNNDVRRSYDGAFLEVCVEFRFDQRYSLAATAISIIFVFEWSLGLCLVFTTQMVQPSVESIFSRRMADSFSHH